MQFLYPYVLIGLVALAIPVIIHLFDFRKPKRVYFTNVRFLKELQMVTKRRTQVKHLLVLLMRLLALASLIIAFAMPVWRNTDDEQVVSGRPLIAVYIDNSYSMQSHGENGLLFEEAIKRAREVADHYAPTDEFFLITNDFSGKYSRIVNRSDFLEMITTVPLSPISRSAVEVMERIADLERRYPGRSVTAYLISDFQRSTFDISASSTDPLYTTFLVPLHRTNLDNLYIDTVWMDVPVVRPGQIVDIQVRIGNTGRAVAEDVPVSLHLNGREAGIGTVTVPGESSGVLKLSTRITGEGIFHGKISLDDYPVTFDDDYYISLEVHEGRVIGGLSGERPERVLHGIFAGDSLFGYRNSPVTQIDFAAINSHDILFCQGVRDFSSGLTDALVSYVAEGGTLVLIPPDPPYDPSGANTLLSALNVALYRELDTTTNRVGHIDFENILYKGVFAEAPTNLAMPVVHAHYPMQPLGNAGEMVVVKLLNGLPLLLESSVGKGRVYQFATSFGSEMTSLAAHAELFVPLIYNMVLYSGIVSPLFYVAGVDKSVAVAWPENPGESLFRIRALGDDTEFIPGYRNEPFGALLFIEDQVVRAGNYQVMIDGREVAPLAFNYSHLESDLRFLTGKELIEWIGVEGLANVKVLVPSGKSMTDKLAEMQDGTRLWRWFILAALVFLLSESLILRFWRKRPDQISV